MLPSYWSVKVFSLKSFPLYSIRKVGNFAYLLVELSNSANKVLPDHDTVIHLFLKVGGVTCRYTGLQVS